MSTFLFTYLCLLFLIRLLDLVGFGLKLDFLLLEKLAFFIIFGNVLFRMSKFFLNVISVANKKISSIQRKDQYYEKNKFLFLKERKKILINIFSDFLKNEFKNLFFSIFGSNFYLAFKKISITTEKTLSKFLVIFVIIISFIDIFSGNERLSIIVNDFRLSSVFNDEFKILKEKKLSGSFIASENNLGILSFMFKTSKKTVDDILIFRIREFGSNFPWYENRYSTSIIKNGQFFPFGFPLIKNSFGKKFEFEIESLSGSENNSIGVDIRYPVRAKYYFDKDTFIKDKKSFFYFSAKKIKNIIKYTDYKYFFTFYLPFILGIIFLYQKRFSLTFLALLIYSFFTSIIALNKILGESFQPLSLQLISNKYFFITVSLFLIFYLLKEILRNFPWKVIDESKQSYHGLLFRLNAFGKNVSVKRLNINFLAVFLLILILIKNLFFVEKINFFDSDEVRLLYDASLINKGLIPFIDFTSRSPLLIYFLSIFIKFGIRDIYFYYLMSSIMIVVSAFFLFQITKELFDQKIALLALFSFMINPMLINMIYVKTQTYSVLLVLLATLLFIKYKKNKRIFNLIFSILALSSAILIRESSVFALFSIFFIDYIFETTSIVKKIITWGKISLVSILPYLFFQLLVFVNSRNQFLPLPNKGLFIRNEGLNNFLILPNYLSPLLVVIIFSTIIYFIVLLIFNYRESILRYFFPIISLASLFIIYFYNFLRHGFWPEYFLEFLPYLSIITGFFLYFLTNRMKKGLILLVILLVSTLLPHEVFRRSLGVFPIEPILKEIVPVIGNTGTKIEILAGSPVFAFLSANDNILHYSHLYYDNESINKILERSLISPPQFIIKDPYWTTFSVEGREKMEEFIFEKYKLIYEGSSLIDGKWTNFEVFSLKR